ncbi:MBL fold metallo-hydrolase [Telmatospirillum sp.]|uniref:MBL fold metallo-hydrolase n=1 Tax=Telmatospirillum sp. TaxID=2079197 RepID=UPI00284C0788|nr:MBL fold metallo-hydrolase [Telmatospirillum sp.]MDR3437250.1 MBL fold metallo-hydrolase [Telmatospirillum sp.]
MSQEQSPQVVVQPVTPFAQNCSLIWDPATGHGAVIDPGGDVDTIVAAIDAKNVAVEKILITHGHVDHAGGAAELAERLGVPIEGPAREDAFLIDDIAQHGQQYGFPACRSFTPGRWLEDGDTVTVGSLHFEVRHCPGHTPGHVVFFHRPSMLAFVGDVLFAGSIGRTDFPRGDHAALIHSITTRLWPMGDDVTFVPGHGPASTFGEERQSNPFVGDRAVKNQR